MEVEEEMKQIGLLSELLRTSTKGNEVSKLSQFLLDLGFCARAPFTQRHFPQLLLYLFRCTFCFGAEENGSKKPVSLRDLIIFLLRGGERPLSANRFLHRLTYLGEGGEP